MTSLLLPVLPWALLALHASAAVLAAFRLTELLLLDKLADKIRLKFGKHYIFSCPRCMSVWCGAASTLLFATVPWLNWPLALSWLYITALDRRAQKKKGQQMTTPDAPRPLDPALAAKMAAYQAQQRPPFPNQAGPSRGMDQIVRDQLGALMMQVLALQAENESLRAQLQAQRAPVVMEQAG